jgi:hypothetical protein
MVLSNRNITWEVKATGAYGWQPHHYHVPIVLKSGSLNLMEPYGPVQACNGIAVIGGPFPGVKRSAREAYSSPSTNEWISPLCLHGVRKNNIYIISPQ